eukprot:3248840-Amphidinium_carterae.1
MPSCENVGYIPLTLAVPDENHLVGGHAVATFRGSGSLGGVGLLSQDAEDEHPRVGQARKASAHGMATLRLRSTLLLESSRIKAA